MYTVKFLFYKSPHIGYNYAIFLERIDINYE